MASSEGARAVAAAREEEAAARDDYQGNEELAQKLLKPRRRAQIDVWVGETVSRWEAQRCASGRKFGHRSDPPGESPRPAPPVVDGGNCICPVCDRPFEDKKPVVAQLEETGQQPDGSKPGKGKHMIRGIRAAMGHLKARDGGRGEEKGKEKEGWDRAVSTQMFLAAASEYGSSIETASSNFSFSRGDHKELEERMARLRRAQKLLDRNDLSLSLSQYEIRQMTHTGGDKEINIIHENPGLTQRRTHQVANSFPPREPKPEDPESMSCVLATHRNQLPGRVTPIVTNAINHILSPPGLRSEGAFHHPPGTDAQLQRGTSLFDFQQAHKGLVSAPLGLGCGILGLCLGLLLCGLLLLGSLGGTCGLGLAVVGRGPQGEVVPEKLHDKSAVPVGLLGQRVELGNGIVEGLLGEVAGTVWGVQDLVVEHREVKGQSQTDGGCQ
ncbi:hypothetical protein FJTKL_04242 [Diaporthe vaccinii]|uniref:Uncharacterized protein n=1 Tax=Diaporthe vaccinii TaxID=105482 RepID=A0ABR4F0A1_9PEZI